MKNFAGTRSVLTWIPLLVALLILYVLASAPPLEL